MNVLADTNIWCRFFREGESTLSALIKHDFLSMHPLVIGELSVGNLPKREQTLKDLRSFPSVRPASDHETHLLIKEHALWGKGLQWNDLLILTSVIATPGTLLWTGDKRLADTAARFNVSYHPP